MPQLQVYLDPCTINCRKVLAGLDLIGYPYDLHHIDYFTGGHKDPEYLKINPNATIPAAVEGNLKITESNAILMYAADQVSNDKFYPKDLKQRAAINTWLLWESNTWFESCYKYLVEYVVKPLLKQEPDQTVIDGHAATWAKQAKILENQLSQTKWLAGEHVTIAE